MANERESRSLPLSVTLEKAKAIIRRHENGTLHNVSAVNEERLEFAKALVAVSETAPTKPAPGCGHAYGSCLHAWDERQGPMPAAWKCGCGARVYRSYEDYCDD